MIPDRVKEILSALVGDEITTEGTEEVKRIIEWVEFNGLYLGLEFNLGSRAWDVYREGNVVPSFNIPLEILERFPKSKIIIELCPKCDEQSLLILENKIQIWKMCLQSDCMESWVHTK